MREIIFRGFTKSGKWIYGLPLLFNKKYLIIDSYISTNLDLCAAGVYAYYGDF